MTQDEIIEMAKEAGMIADEEMWFSSFYKIEQDVHISHLKAFAKLVAQHEREACAKVCDEFPDVGYIDKKLTSDYHAHLIRQRGQA
jgi:hypothetical protein